MVFMIYRGHGRSNLLTFIAQSVTGPLPTYTTFPVGQIEAVEEEDDDDDDVVGFITPCNLWFFNVSQTMRSPLRVPANGV